MLVLEKCAEMERIVLESHRVSWIMSGRRAAELPNTGTQPRAKFRVESREGL